MLKCLFLLELLATLVYAGPLPKQETNEISIRPNHVGRMTGRIINGTDTTIEENPHQISIQLKDQGHWCGGTIISNYWILTAAHCVLEEDANFMILAGTKDVFEGGSLHPIRRIIVHEDFSSQSRTGNDVALLSLEKPIVFDATKRPIPMFLKNEETEAGSIGIVTGWGETGSGFSDILNRVEIPIMSLARCKELYNWTNAIGDGQICAGYEEGGKDACDGDSGGPLTIDGRLAGIVSWGLGCALAGNPGVYTEVAYFRDWIKKHSGI